MKDLKKLVVNPNKKILVLGDLMIDHYVFGNCNRISPEAPVPVFEKNKEKFMLGGAGNVVNNLAGFEVNCDLVGVIGDDIIGEKLSEILNLNKYISTDGIFVDLNRKTTLKQRFIAGGQQLLRVDSETKFNISVVIEKKILDFINTRLNDYEIILISDYNKGVVTEHLCEKVIELCNSNGIFVMVDPKGDNFSKYRNANLIKPNLKEFMLVMKIDNIQPSELSKIAESFKKNLGIDKLVITLGESGIFFSDDYSEIIPTNATNVYDVSGAGDTVFASLAFCLMNNISLDDSCKFANAAASIVIQKFGTETTNINDVTRKLKENAN